MEARRRTRFPSAYLGAAMLCLGLALSVTGVAGAEIPRPPGWTPVLVDDFDGPAGSAPSAERWRVDLGHGYPGGPPNWGTQEIQRYTADPANLALDGEGHLLISPQRGPDGEWTSARIESVRDDFLAPAGGMLRIEARILMPGVSGQAALGYWPAFWALGRSYRETGAWPAAGEFDIMESVNGLDSVWGILHCDVNPGGACGEPHGIGASRACPGTPCPGHFHVYTFEWDRSVTPEELRWYVDGQLLNRIVQTQLPAATWRALTDQGGFFLLLNVAIGGGFSFAMAGWISTPTPATEPGHPMAVDYVAVWTRPGPAAQPARSTRP